MFQVGYLWARKERVGCDWQCYGGRRNRYKAIGIGIGTATQRRGEEGRGDEGRIT